jgi:hypothetical protein
VSDGACGSGRILLSELICCNCNGMSSIPSAVMALLHIQARS